MMDREILAVMEASAVRRWLAILTLVTVAALLAYAAFSSGASVVLQAGGLIAAFLAVVAATRLHRATMSRIELTADGLVDSRGTEIARLDDIASLDRGFLAFKPSNGFVLRTKTRGERTWQPGLWWRFGHRVGVGGVVPGQQSRFLADQLNELLAKRS